MALKNGHQFHKSAEPDPREVWPPGRGGDFGCVLCGAWTTYKLSQEQADHDLGPCPKRKEPDDSRSHEAE